MDHADAHIGHDQLARPVDGAAEGQVDAEVGHVIEGLVRLGGDGQLLGGDDRRHAPGKEHARHADDEGLNLQIAHAEALHQAEDDADGQHQQDDGGGAGPAPVVQAVGNDHAVHGDEGAHGDVDAAGEHDAGHAAGHADQARVAAEYVQKGLDRGKALAGVSHAARRIQNEKQYDGDQQQRGVAVHLLALFQRVCRFHTPTAPFTSFSACRLADSFLKNAFTGGAWTATITMTMTALNTGLTALDTPRLYMVVVMAWMV